VKQTLAENFITTWPEKL